MQVLAAFVMIAVFPAAAVREAVMLPERCCIDAASVRAAEFPCRSLTAVQAEPAGFADLILLEALAAIIAEDMLIISVILRTDAMLAVRIAFRAHVAVFTELLRIKAFAAVDAEMLLPLLIVVRADFVNAVIIRSAVLAASAVIACRVVRTDAAFRAKMLLIFCGFHAVAVRTAGTLACCFAACGTQAAVSAELLALRADTFAAFRAEPVIILTAEDTVVAAGGAHRNFAAETGVTFRAVRKAGVGFFTQTALITEGDLRAAGAAVPAVAGALQTADILQTPAAKLVLFAPVHSEFCVDLVLSAAKRNIVSAKRACYVVFKAVITEIHVQIMEECALLKISVLLKAAFSAEIAVIITEMAVYTEHGIAAVTLLSIAEFKAFAAIHTVIILGAIKTVTAFVHVIVQHISDAALVVAVVKLSAEALPAILAVIKADAGTVFTVAPFDVIIKAVILIF